MEIRMNGLKRDSGAWLVTRGKVSDAGSRIPKSTTDQHCVRVTDEGVSIYEATPRLTLGGNFLVEVRLTHDDIARLYLARRPELAEDFGHALADKQKKANASAAAMSKLRSIGKK